MNASERLTKALEILEELDHPTNIHERQIHAALAHLWAVQESLAAVERRLFGQTTRDERLNRLAQEFWTNEGKPRR